MKSTIFRLFSVVTLTLFALQNAQAAEVVVISNPGITVSAEDIKDIFLGEKQFVGRTQLVVIDNISVQSGFLSQYMHMEVARYNNIWTKKSFRDGLSPPAVKSGDAEVIEYVKRTPGAIGYVSHPAEGVNVVQ
ncbi:MAG: hypothetical protein ABI536_02585 [Gallionella sp.]